MGEDCVNKFVQFLMEKWEEIKDIKIKIKHGIHMTDSDRLKHDRQKKCSICKNCTKLVLTLIQSIKDEKKIIFIFCCLNFDEV